MTQQNLAEILEKSFFNDFSLHKRRPDLYQLIVPLYHDDGDMMDIFIKADGNDITICDCGLTLMRLSYDFDPDTPNQQKILDKIVREAGAYNDDGNICLAATPDMLFESVMQMSQVISKVASMKLLQRHNVNSLFYEQLDKYIDSSFTRYTFQKSYSPIAGRDELKVDYAFQLNQKPVFVFAVRGDSKAQRSIISMLSFQKEKMPFTGIVVHDDYGNLSRDNQKLIMNTADKQYYDFKSFMSNKDEFANKYLA